MSKVSKVLDASNVPKMAVTKWGKDHQLLVMVEEMGEAISAISQMVNRGRDTEQKVIDELGDVCLMMAQAQEIYGTRLESAVKRSIAKLHIHIGGEDAR